MLPNLIVILGETIGIAFILYIGHKLYDSQSIQPTGSVNEMMGYPLPPANTLQTETEKKSATQSIKPQPVKGNLDESKSLHAMNILYNDIPSMENLYGKDSDFTPKKANSLFDPKDYHV